MVGSRFVMLRLGCACGFASGVWGGRVASAAQVRLVVDTTPVCGLLFARAHLTPTRIVCGMSISTVNANGFQFVTDPTVVAERAAAIPQGVACLYSPVWLSAMYVSAHCSIHKIACVLGVQDHVVKMALVSSGIPVRSDENRNKVRFEALGDAEYLFDALVVRKLFLREVAREVGCAEQIVKKATRSPEMAVMLADAGWKEGWPASRPHIGRQSLLPQPSEDELVGLVVRLSVDGWAAEKDMRTAAGLSVSQHHSFHSLCQKAVARGVIEYAKVRFGKSCPSNAYRLAAGSDTASF